MSLVSLLAKSPPFLRTIIHCKKLYNMAHRSYEV